MIEWRFKPNSRDDMDVDPIQGEFFTTRDIGNISNAVVREGIQNALDERCRDSKTQIVKVRIFLSGDKYALDGNEANPLFDTLVPHLKAKSSGIPALPNENSRMKFLTFEDFNTRGLEGDPSEFYIETNDGITPHNFYYFWRNVGRSGKTDDKLGRWGLGKTVFPASSKINTFFGVTVRKSDQKKMLLGQSILRVHNRDDNKKQECGYKPYGMFGNYESTDCFASPIQSQEWLDRFENIFRLQRKNDPGLSLIIPHCSDEITIDYLAYSVIEQYFYPILEGKLIVEIAEEDKVITFEKNSLDEAIEKIDFPKLFLAEDSKIKSKESLLKLFDFAKWTFDLVDDDFYKLNELSISNKPRWNKTVMFKDEIGFEKVREHFEAGQRIAIKIPLKVHPVNGIAKTCYYNAFLEKDTSLIRPENLFVRDGITISGITSLDRGLVRGIVIIHDIDLTRMLGDSENPAHTEWQADSRNFKGKYNDGKEALIFVKSTLKQIFEKLQRPVEGIQKDLLIDYFSIPIETNQDLRQKELPDQKSGDDETPAIDLPEIVRRVQPFTIEKIHSGLKLSKSPVATEIPESIKMRLGYDVPRGNPINSYQELDFDVAKAPVKIQSSGVYFTIKEKNVLEFQIETDQYFEIILTGFDEKRDLFLKLQ
jgi:hypothetical protein